MIEDRLKARLAVAQVRFNVLTPAYLCLMRVNLA